MARKEYNPQGWEQGDEWWGERKKDTDTQSQQDPRKGEPTSIYYLVLYYAHTFLASSAAVLWFSGAIKEVDVIKCSFACR